MPHPPDDQGPQPFIVSQDLEPEDRAVLDLLERVINAESMLRTIIENPAIRALIEYAGPHPRPRLPDTFPAPLSASEDREPT